VVLIIVEQLNDIPDDLGLLLILEVLEVLVDASRLEVIRKELVVPDLEQLLQDLILVVADVVNVEHRLRPP
jgi:hypothetical protein